MFQNLRFLTTVADWRQLPQEGWEVAFAGRSNAGKSSAINTLARHKRLAFTSKTPGRTQHINYFALEPATPPQEEPAGEPAGAGHAEEAWVAPPPPVWRLVDLPGYGYAKVSATTRQRWEHLLSRYLATRPNLVGLVLMMDARHPFMPLDEQMLDWFAPTGKPVHLLLTKADKLSRQEQSRTLAQARDRLAAECRRWPQCSVQLFSSFSALGRDEAEQTVTAWLRG